MISGGGGGGGRDGGGGNGEPLNQLTINFKGCFPLPPPKHCKMPLKKNRLGCNVCTESGTPHNPQTSTERTGLQQILT